MSRYAKPGQTIEDLKRMITDNGGGVMKLYTKYGEPCAEHFVKSSVVKSCRDDYFCKWTIKFA